MPGIHTYIRSDVVEKLRKEGILEEIMPNFNDFVNNAILYYIRHRKKTQKKLGEFREYIREDSAEISSEEAMR